jgi:hypothetical protein
MEVLEQAARAGWTSELRERFIRAYDAQIGRWVLNLCVHYGLITSAEELRALREHVEARLHGAARDSFSPLVDVLADVYVRTYQAVFHERTLKKLGSLGSESEKYLFGIVRHQFFAALGKDELSERELLERLVESRRLRTQENYLGEAKARLWERARAALLCLPALEPESAQRLCAEVQRHIDAITHYFFESFLPERYARTRHDFESLLENFRREHYRAEGLPQEIISYRAQVSRRPQTRFVSERELERAEGRVS